MNCRKIKCAGKAGLALVAVVALGWGVMLLWNWVMPALFGGARTIDFLHALGLLVLSRILFGGVGGRGGGRRWRHDKMSPDEREKFRARMREKWGWGAAAPRGGTEAEPSA